MIKRCSKCRIYKDEVEFNRNRAALDGFQNQCRACEKIGRRSYYERNADKVAAYGHAHRKANAEYHETRKKIFNETARGRELQRQYAREQRKRYPEKEKARKALSHAIESGKLKRLACEQCGKKRSQAHHHKGYAPEFWLDVQWLCIKCHREAHACLTSGIKQD